jgi:hypothetical protein
MGDTVAYDRITTASSVRRPTQHATGWIEALFWVPERSGLSCTFWQLVDQPWGTREFGMLDSDGNLITFSSVYNAPSYG